MRVSDERLLALFAKAPLPGQVKTRLAAQTSEPFAVALADALLRDCVQRYQTVADRRLVLFTPAENETWFREVAGSAFALEAQADGDLGARLAALFAKHATGGRRVIALGTDSPNLPRDWVGQAFAQLSEADAVLGPAVDGGYYLIACRGFFPALFDSDGWGGPSVLGQTVARAQRLGLRLSLLPPWYDVDTLDDCRFLKQHLQAQRLAGIDPACQRTEALLRDLP